VERGREKRHLKIHFTKDYVLKGSGGETIKN